VDERKFSRRRALGAGAALVGTGLAAPILRQEFARGDNVVLPTEEEYLAHLQEEYSYQEQVRMQAQACADSCGNKEFWGSMAFAQSAGDNLKFKIFVPGIAGKDELPKRSPTPTPTTTPTPEPIPVIGADRPKWGREVLLSPVFKGPSDRPYVGLTIDDGYFSRDEILNTLISKNVSATFFIIGSLMEAYSDFIRRARDSGLTERANHTWTHTDLRFKSWSQIANDEMKRSQDYSMDYFSETLQPYGRPYGGNRNTAVDSAFADRNFRDILWNVSGDAGNYTPSQLVSLYLGQLDRMANPKGSIILLHFRTATAQALPAIIDGIRARDLEPVKLSKLYEGGRV